jgi:hypothetical protein
VRKKMAAFWVVAPCSLVEFEVLTAVSMKIALIALIMEAARTSETLVNIEAVFSKEQ